MNNDNRYLISFEDPVPDPSAKLIDVNVIMSYGCAALFFFGFGMAAAGIAEPISSAAAGWSLLVLFVWKAVRLLSWFIIGFCDF